jgi:hypothetical protein
VDEVVEAMGLSDTRKVYRPVLHGVGWLGDVRRIALRMYKLKALGFKFLRRALTISLKFVEASQRGFEHGN